MNYILLSTSIPQDSVRAVEHFFNTGTKKLQVAYLATAANTYKNKDDNYPEWSL